MPTASELLRETAPGVIQQVDEFEARLEALSDAAQASARELGLQTVRVLDEEWLFYAPEESARAVQLRTTGLIGTGVTRVPDSGKFTPVVFVELDHPVLRISLEPGDARELELYWRLLRELDIHPGEAVLIGLPEPVAQVGPRDRAFCNGPPGSFGARVTTSNGQRGILTAGHVCPKLNSGAYTSGSTYVGTVIETHDIASLPARQAGMDIAVVELSRAVPDTGSITPSSLAPRPGQIWDGVVGHGARTPGAQATLLSAGRPFAGPSRQRGHWDDALLTDRPISTDGDSGGMVLLADSGELVGHVVGGYPGVYSVLQDAEAQLRAVGGKLR